MKITLLSTCVLFFSGAAAAATCPELKIGQAGAAPTDSAAVAIAKSAMAGKFSAEELATFEPYHADLKGPLWHVYGSLPREALGGTPEAEVCRATAAVIRVYLTQ